jgi:hypothetical protein
LGDGVVAALAAAQLTSYTGRLRAAATAGAGAAMAVAAGTGSDGPGARPALIVLGLGMVGWALLGRGLSPFALAGLTAGLAALWGALG